MLWNGFSRLMMAFCIYFMLGLMLNFRYGINGSLISMWNTFLSMITLILLLIYAYKVKVLVVENQNNIADDAWIAKYGALTEYIKPDSSVHAKQHAFIFILKRFWVCFIIVFLGESQGLQIGMLSFTYFASFLWLLFHRPFSVCLMNFIELYTEFAFFAVSTSLSLFLILPDYSNEVSITIIVLCVTMIIVSGLQVPVELVTDLCGWIQKKRASSKITHVRSVADTEEDMAVRSGMLTTGADGSLPKHVPSL